MTSETSSPPDAPTNRIAVLEHQNRLLLAQAEALHKTLAERNDEITRLSILFLEAEAETAFPAPEILKGRSSERTEHHLDRVYLPQVREGNRVVLTPGHAPAPNTD